MNFFEALWSEAQVGRTPWLLLLLVAVLVLRHLAIDRPKVKLFGFFVATHLLLLIIAAAMAAVNSRFVDDVRTPAWVVGAVAFVDGGATLLFRVFLPRTRVTLPRILQDVIVAVVSGGVAVAVASRAGVNLSGLIATSAVLTAVLGFSLQDVIGNVAGGLALQVDTSIEVGDWVKVNDIIGKVVEIRWRHTAVETRNWETVLIPNSVIMKSQVMVLGRRKGEPRLWRRWVYFSVDYRHQPSDVIEAVQNAVRGARIPNVAVNPPPNCVLMDISESYGKYAVRYWLEDLALDDPTDSEVRNRIFFALHRSSMQLAIPAHAVFVTEETSDRAQYKSTKELKRRQALLDGCALFAGLEVGERQELAQGLRYAPFTRGETITRQGAEAHWLYIIEDGTAVVRVIDAETAIEKDVAKLTKGNFFGEMSLLTGAPRQATVVAETDVECFRLEKKTFQAVLERRPEMAKDLASILSRRRVELDAVRKGLDAESAARRQETDAHHLLDKIRSFFNLS